MPVPRLVDAPFRAARPARDALGRRHYVWPSTSLNSSTVHRYYDPTTGQFLSVDPAVSITGEPYAYVQGDPVNNSDPQGLAPQPERWTQAERDAVDAYNSGRDYDPTAYKSAQEKAKTNQKRGWSDDGSEKLPAPTRRSKGSQTQRRGTNQAAQTPCPIPVTPPSPELNGNWGFHPPPPVVTRGLVLGGGLLVLAVLLAPAGA